MQRAPRLRIDSDGETMFWRARPLDLDRHPALRRILIALVDASFVDRSLTTRELAAVGWPDERFAREAGANRVYVAIATLRQAGMREAIVRTHAGYALRADVDDGRAGVRPGPRSSDMAAKKLRPPLG